MTMFHNNPGIPVRSLGVFLTCALMLLAGSGCGSSGPATPRQSKGTAFASATRQDVFNARWQAMSAADSYVPIIVQALDELRARTNRPELVTWAMEHRIATALASFTNASEVNGYVALLDMLVYARLKRHALEEHWIPTLLHEDGQPMLEAYQRGERDVWQKAARVLSQKQLDELAEVIEAWRKENPTQYYVSHIQFTDFASAMRITADSAKAKAPSSVFGLLYIDPLAGLDPVARELQEYRAVTERLSYFASRMPIIIGWQVDLAVRRSTTDPQVSKIVDNTSKFVDSSARFADATVRFADTVKKFPQDLRAERTEAVQQIDAATTRQVKSALDQTFAGITQQREAIVKDLEAQESRARAIVSDVRGVVERADEAGRSLNAATSQTIDAAERSTRRTLNHALLLIIGAVAVILISLFVYRYAIKRWVFEGETQGNGRAAKANGGSFDA
jgi:hypothetical protein